MKTLFYDRIMLEDECKAITRMYEQSLVVENVTFNTKTEHNFIASRNSNRAVRTSRRRYNGQEQVKVIILNLNMLSYISDGSARYFSFISNNL